MLEIQHLSAGYAGVPVVKDVSFGVRMGESACVLGPNGCGKTTLLRAIARLIPFTGEVRIGGQDIKTLTRRELAREVAVMSQVSTLHFAYSVYDTVMMGRYLNARALGGAGRADRAVVEGCLKAIGLWDIREQPIDALSGGQLQRVFLAKALAQQPRVILLDEPTNHLDIKCQMELIEYLKDWMTSGEHAVIGVFHDVNLALTLAERLIFMKEGRVAGQGAFPDVAEPAFLEGVYGMDVAGYMRRSLKRWG
ncbi:ABC transporter ATP-binding protein [Bacillota bacterium Meth-B3]|nr:ABC transporter ATP-binding protein [Christensenellaceae bacterium]MEA5065451.1 ABC transporter ATP-binding protein [Eubacteriales bacterium]